MIAAHHHDLKLKLPTRAHVAEYEHAYKAVAHRFGRRAPGRNIIQWGHDGHRPATDREVVASIRVLRRMLAPAPAPPSPVPVTSSSTTSAPVGFSSGGGGALPACTWQPESGGNPSAVNPTSRAGGYYQILPSTWAAYGGSGAPQDASMSQQTAIAQKIWANQGPSAWNNC